jgi:tRNA(Ile)-lysidine synthase
MDLIGKVEQGGASAGLFAAGDGMVVAVSGGPDSVALLHLLHTLSAKWHWRLTAAHVNHGFRGEESDREAEFVAELCRRLGIPLETGVVDAPAFIRETGRNSQDAARKLRYDFLLETARQAGASKVALAHHADDQAETVLMRVLRGTGPSGLAGIPASRRMKNVELIRPLLRIYKEELIGYCAEAGLSYCFDSSNAKRTYTRNRVRLDALPFLQQFNPRLPEALNRLIQMMEAEDAYLLHETEKAFRRIAVSEGSGYSFSRTAFAGLHLALQRRLIKLILNYLSSGTESGDASGFVQTELIRSAALQEQPPNLTLDAGGGVVFRREYDRLFIAAGAPETDNSYYYIVGAEDGDLFILEAGIKLQYRIAEGTGDLPVGLSNDTVVFDLEKVRFPVAVRTRQEGDRIRIPGLNGSKKVKDIYIDEKVPPRLRNQLPVVVDAEGQILWLPGYRRSVHSVVTEKTKRYFCMTISGLEQAQL